MPWVYRSYSNRPTRVRARLRRWAFDHRSELIAAEIGVGVVASFGFLVLIFLKVL